MNTKQMKILKIAIGVILLMLIFPPFQASNFFKPGLIDNLGYDFILTPPSSGIVDGTVNIGLLCVQWLGVVIVGAGCIFAARD